MKTFRSALVLSAFAFLSVPSLAMADESGVSFWVPGFFGSLAATPQQPGWSLAMIYYHTSVSAGADVALAREFQTARFPANLTGSLNASVKATGDVGLIAPSYVFATPVLGGQAAFALVLTYFFLLTREDIRLKLALDRVAADVKRIPMAQAEAREAIWTPEQEKTKDVPKLWTPGG